MMNMVPANIDPPSMSNMMPQEMSDNTQTMDTMPPAQMTDETVNTENKPIGDSDKSIYSDPNLWLHDIREVSSNILNLFKI